jgi:hypothetical protein
VDANFHCGKVESYLIRLVRKHVGYESQGAAVCFRRLFPHKFDFRGHEMLFRPLARYKLEARDGARLLERVKVLIAKH